MAFLFILAFFGFFIELDRSTFFFILGNYNLKRSSGRKYAKEKIEDEKSSDEKMY